jgi:hypothetical protein
MSRDQIRIVEHEGSHLLVRRGDSFAILERRNGRLYDVRGEDRTGHPDSPEGIVAAVGPDGWGEEAATRAAFAEAVARGKELASRIW